MVVLLAIVAVVAAQAESAALVLIALTADAVARGTDLVRLSLGPVAVEPSIATTGIVTLASIAAAACLVLTYGWLEARVVAYLDREARDQIVLSYAQADWEYQSTQKSGRMQSRVRLMTARGQVFSGLIGWCRGLATVSVFVLAAAIMSPVAAVVIVACGSVLSFVVWPIRRSTKAHARQLADAEVDLTEEFGDAVEQGPDVQVFGAWPVFIDRFAHRSSTLERLRRRVDQLYALLPVVYQYGALALIVVTMSAASIMETNGELGQFAASGLLLLRSIQYGQMLQISLHVIARFSPGVDTLERELRIPPPKVVPAQFELDRIEQLELRDIEYSYPGSEQPALQGISMALRPGSIVGLAGPSGSGKSTLAQVLLRLRWPTAGEYRVNGRDAAEFAPGSWSRLVLHVPQQPHLIHASLYDNITFFDPSISRERVLGALGAVGLDSLVETLPGGLDASLGPTGRSLSGGQVQRLAIARALVREPKVVVLDEPTSALDAAAERMVGDALSALRGHHEVIVVVIAHRPSTLALCDEIVVLENGRILASGPAIEISRSNESLAMTWTAADGQATSGYARLSQASRQYM